MEPLKKQVVHVFSSRQRTPVNCNDMEVCLMGIKVVSLTYYIVSLSYYIVSLTYYIVSLSYYIVFADVLHRFTGMFVPNQD